MHACASCIRLMHVSSDQICMHVCVQEVTGGLESITALAKEMPTLVATLHGNLRQTARDLDSLTKTHPACADVAPLCSQVRAPTASFHPSCLPCLCASLGVCVPRTLV
jgi:hypothetical protein